MSFGKYRIVITDYSGTYKNGEIKANDFTSLSIIDCVNDFGSWRIKSRTKDPCPIGGNDNIIVFRDNVQIYSGIVMQVTEEYEVKTKSWIWEATGVNHFGLMKHRLIYPYMTDDHTIKYRYYTTTSGAKADTVIKNLIDLNMCDVQTSVFRRAGFAIVEGADFVYPFETYPDYSDVNYRFDNLMEIVTEIANHYDIRIYPVMDPETYKITYFIRPIVDISSNVCFSVENNEVLRFRKITKAPEITKVVMSLNSDKKDQNIYSNPEMWKFVAAANAAGDIWFTTRKQEQFLEPKEEDLNETYTYSKLYDLTYRQANSIKLEPVGYEIDVNLIDSKYVYGYDMDRSDYPAVFTNDYRLGDIIGISFQGSTYTGQVTKMEFGMSYGKESIKPTIGKVSKGKFTDLITGMRSNSANLNKINNAARS